MNEILTGAMYGVFASMIMAVFACWTRKLKYWVFFIVGAVAIPGGAFLSSAIRYDRQHAVDTVLPRIMSVEGIFIMIGFGLATIVLIWLARNIAN